MKEGEKEKKNGQNSLELESLSKGTDIDLCEWGPTRCQIFQFLNNAVLEISIQNRLSTKIVYFVTLMAGLQNSKRAFTQS